MWHWVYVRAQLIFEEVKFDPLNLCYFCLLNFSFSWSISTDVCFRIHIYCQPDCQVFLGCSRLHCFALFISICLQSSNLEKEENFPNMYFYLIGWYYFKKTQRQNTVLTEHARCRNEQIQCCAAEKLAVWCPGQEGGGSLWYSLLFLLRKTSKIIPWAIE